MKIRLGTQTGSPETGTGSTGMYWNDGQDRRSGVSRVIYTDKRGRPRLIWPDSEILHIQSVRLDLTQEIARQIANFDTQRQMLGRGAGHTLALTVNGKTYLCELRNTRWDAGTSTLHFLRNNGPMPGRIDRGDYATVKMVSPETSLTVVNETEELSVLVPHLAPVTTCDVVMTAGWRDGAGTSSDDTDRGHVLLCDAAGAGEKEVVGQYSAGGGGKKGGGSPQFWDGEETVRGISYNGSVKAQGPVGKCSVIVTWPAYRAEYTVRILHVEVA